MQRDEAAERARRLNRELGESGKAKGAFFIEEEVRPGEWEPVKKREQMGLLKRLFWAILDYPPF
jgi:hypothetical protein